ncbi:hypothetical protein ACA910_016627 [Epithemia clementina (nom. ined.)]
MPSQKIVSSMEDFADADDFGMRRPSSEPCELDELMSRLSVDVPRQSMNRIGTDGRCCLSPIAKANTPSPTILPSQEVNLDTIEGNEKFQTKGDSSDPKMDRSTNCSILEGDNVSPQQPYEHISSDTVAHEQSEAADILNLSTSEDSILQQSDIEAARNLIGVSSRVFIEQLRGAALRRKVDLARSRDSLVAKEREQLQAIAASKEAAELSEQCSKYNTAVRNKEKSTPRSFKARPIPPSTKTTGVSGIPKVEKRPSTVPRSPLIGKRRSTQKGLPSEDRVDETLEDTRPGPFKARRLPKATEVSGHGGLVGLAKVQKRPITIPKSPLLGLRKPALGDSHKTISSENTNAVFKARPLPKTTGDTVYGGLAGVTKVAKRQATIPVSPLLGARRSKPQAIDSVKSCKIGRESTGMHLSASDLIGVRLIDTPSENLPPNKTPPRSVSRLGEFIPHSTIRAQKRAEFEVSRRIHEIERDKEESSQRRKQVHALEKELCFLREKI